MISNLTKYGTAVLMGLIVTSVMASKGIDGVLITLKADDLRVVQAGEKVYQANCAACHGQYLEGQPDWRTRDANGFLPAPPHDATGHTWHHADDLLFEITKYGPGAVIGDSDYKSSMPVYENILSDDEIIAVLSFIKNTWPEEQREWQEQMNGEPKGFSISGSKKGTSILDKLSK